MNNDLNHRQAAFVQEYLIDYNATQAAIRAGYSDRGAYSYGLKLLQIEKIKHALNEARQKRNERTQIDQDYVIDQLVEIVQRSMQVRPVLDRKGNETGVYAYRDVVAVRALALLAKHTGGFNNNHDAAQNITVVVDTGVPGPPASRMPSGATSSRHDPG
jgi:phage terminase small subunit